MMSPPLARDVEAAIGLNGFAVVAGIVSHKDQQTADYPNKPLPKRWAASHWQRKYITASTPLSPT
jgi:hypothetical protein